jgi:hypothetical protein
VIRRTGILLIIILFAGVIVLGYYLNRSRKDMVIDPYRAVPQDAAIVIETYDIRSLVNSVTTGKGIFGEMKNVKEFSGFSSGLQFIADQVNKPGFRKILQEGTALISFHPLNGRLRPFFSKAVPSEAGFRQLREAFISSGITNLQEMRINGKKILALPYISAGRTDTLYVSLSAGLVTGTSSKELLLQSFSLAGTGEDIRSFPGFSEIFLSSGKKEDRLFIIFDNLRHTVSGFFGSGHTSPVNLPERLSGCAGGGIYLDDNGISLSGYSTIQDTSGRLPGYRTAVPSEFKCYRILPSATSLFKSTLFIADIKKEKAETIADLKLLKLAEDLKPYIGEEVTNAYIDIRDNPVNRNSLLIYELKNRMQCETIIMRHLGDKPRISYFSPDDQSRMPVFTGGINGLGSVLMPGFVSGFTDSCFTFYDNYLVTGNSFITISRFLYDNMLKKTLANDVYYREFEKTIPTRTGFLFYCVPSRCLGYLSGFLSEKTTAGLLANESSIGKIGSVGFQQASISGMVYNNLTISFRDAAREESETEWETLLDTAAAIKPFFFTNHNTGAREIFIQDIRNNIYLINAAGRVLWKVPVKERINGQIYMIDYYRNGKYQLLFAGVNNLHLIDRNGNYVDRYPVRLRSPATNSLALFDYENNRNYRLVIAGEDKLLYSYDKSGNVIKGWVPFRTAGFVSSEAGFYKVSGKDYIVVADESTIYFLDRSGKERLRLNDAVTRAKGSAIRMLTGPEQALVCTSPDGTLQTIYFNGSVKKFRFRTFSFDHSFDFFDVDGDGFGEYVFIDKGILYLYDHNLKEMFSKDFSSERLGGPISFTFSSQNRKIGVFDIDKNLIYLINSKGEIMKGFPLKGASMFSIGKLGSGSDWNLIVGGTDRFLYNYKLETTPN